jgi:hypothetical protein
METRRWRWVEKKRGKKEECRKGYGMEKVIKRR